MRRASGTLISAGTFLLAACSGGTPDTLSERASYAIGLDMGNSVEQMGGDVDLDMLIQGLRDALGEQEPQMDQQEIAEVMQEFFQQMQETNAARQQELMESNSQAGETFLAQNRTKGGVVETPSGLQYEVLTEGTGLFPSATNQVTVHYEGKLLDGKVFDSSYERGEPASFRLNGVIAGWTEGVQLMKVGSKFRFFIPPNLGYGENGAGQDIGPNATLIFEVELLGIEQ